VHPHRRKATECSYLHTVSPILDKRKKKHCICVLLSQQQQDLFSIQDRIHPTHLQEPTVDEKASKIRNIQIREEGKTNTFFFFGFVGMWRGVLVLWLLAVASHAEDDTARDDFSQYESREILNTIYQATGGTLWNSAINWTKSTIDICNWGGVICYPPDYSDSRRIGHVQELNLKNNRLVNTMPATVFDLPYLEILNIEDNVDASIDLSNIGNAQFLKELDVSNTNVDNIDDVGGASSLETLVLTNLKLTGPLPSGLFSLTNMEFLYASDNTFSGSLPTEIGKLTALRELWLDDSDLTGQLPSQLESVAFLSVLSMSNNALDGALPISALNALTNLKTLALQRDETMLKGGGIVGEIPSFSNHRLLTTLYLQNHRLSGSLDPNFLMDCPERATVDVDLSSNQISGSVPSSLQDKKFLNLNLANNRITVVPAELYDRSSGSCIAITNWMDGNVKTVGCDAFLCPPGTWAPEGRATRSDTCASCTEDDTIWGRTTCSSAAADVNDRQVLVSLYNALGGRSWTRDDNWLNLDGDVCNWYGITCTNGLVSTIDLSDNGLSGTPPRELFSLAALNNLNLEMNSISFSFEGISSSSNLEVLNLASTNMPQAAIREMQELQTLSSLSILSIASNRLGGTIPSVIFSLSALTELNLGHNDFNGTLDSRIGQLASLQQLHLDGNMLTGQFPTQIGNLVNLQELNAGENQFEGTLPTGLNLLVNLRSLSMQQVVTSGGIKGPMLSFSNLAQLTSLQLGSNALSGTLPNDLLSNSANLDVEIFIDLSDNGFEGEVPSQWSRFDSLFIDLAGNRISGIDSALCQQTNWMRGDVAKFGCDAILCPKGTSNSAGRQSDTQSDCASCSSGGGGFFGAKSCSSQTVEFGTNDGSETSILLDFFGATYGTSWNQTTGWDNSADVCSFYGVKCVNGLVSTIDLTGNGLRGTVPSSIFKLPQLTELILSKNAITISFEAIGDATALTVLRLDDADLPSISGLSKATSLDTLSLAGTNLQGEIPNAVLSLPNLRKLNLGYNLLTGRIPNFIGTITTLEVLELYHNQFTGRIPASLGDLSGLTVLNLAENNFDGTIPQALNDLTNLQFLSLQREGGVLGSSDVGINQKDSSALGAGFTGPLPSFNRLAVIKELYLGMNSLTGSIPYNFLDGVIATDSEIRVDLMSNLLTGTIPASLTQFENLSLYAADNRITAIESALCDQAAWLDGNVGQYLCAGILCPVGTFSTLGRQTAELSCETCSEGANSFMGSVECLSGAQKQENSERAVLEQLYNEMNGENWLVNTNWMDPDESVCTWYGITCPSATNRTVISIELEDNRLLNALPARVWNSLPNLETLNLKKNEIEVSLQGISSATSLRYLDLSETGLNTLTGVQGAGQLTGLLADGNSLSSFPWEILGLSGLRTLSLSDNPFSKTTLPELHQLPELSYIGLSSCGITGTIPTTLGLMTQLEYLKLGKNVLMGGLPTELRLLTNLRHLDLSDQHSYDANGIKQGLDGKLLAFAKHPQLSELFLQYNSLSGTIPFTFMQSNLNSGLVTVDLRHNRLKGGIPVGLSSTITNLNIYLAANLLTSLDPSLCNTDWNGGNTERHGCDAIICGNYTYNAYGRAVGSLGCIPCKEQFSLAHLGETSCGSTREHSALIALYETTGGPDWKSAINWLRADDHCTWEGITCHTEGDLMGLVKEINLEDNNLIGDADGVLIWDLVGLEVVNLQKNTVRLPFLNVGNAANLQRLYISDTSTTSLDGIGEAMSLQELHATNAQLFGSIPQELFGLSNLERLFLSQNLLTGDLPSQIGRLTNLVDLYISENDMDGSLPSEIGRLSKLQHLSLGKNKFVGILPRQINSLSRLEMLSIEKKKDVVLGGFDFSSGESGLNGNVPAFSGLSRIKELYLGHNSFTGTIPDSFLQGVTNKTGLIVVDLSYNNIVGTIPASLANFGDLQLDLARNLIHEIAPKLCEKDSWFNGEVANGCDAILCPPKTFNSYGRRVDSTTLCRPCTYPDSAISYGSVDCGPIFVEEKGDRQILMELYMATGGSEWTNSEGWKSDSVCEWFGITCESGSPFVSEIDLHSNNLKGTVPADVFHLPELKKLNVRHNDISIDFNPIFRAEKLEELRVDKTLVFILDGIGQATSLKLLHLHQNSFGWQPIPDELFNLASLEELDLSESMFGGTLSSKVGQLVNVQKLSLVDNAITGQIPDEIGNLMSVRELDLSGNNWYGKLPTTVSGLTSLTSFKLNNPHADNVGVAGPMPSFSTMPNLRSLYLSNNQFTGTIPNDFLSGITNREQQISVYLNGNHLVGVVPSSLTSLERLNIYLQNNLLTGYGTGICLESQWMDGNVGLYGCDAILCPAGEYSPTGRQDSANTACKACPDLEGSRVMGSNVCPSIQQQIEKNILVSLFEETNGLSWKRQDGWKDDSVDICKWYGIKCRAGATVESILLGSNGLVGTVPSSVYKLPYLKYLWLYSNHVDLRFDGIEQATSLTSLLLDSTKIRNLDGIGNGLSLVDVDVRFNNLKGTLPSELSKLVELESFTCSQNSFTGTVPSLSRLRKLKTLRMGNNDFSGAIPSFLEHPVLVTLDLSDNQLDGSIPDDLLGDMVKSEEAVFLDLSGNQLTGTVPGKLSRFAQMTLLLRDNRISGINPNLCDQTLWNGGDVLEFRCDAILCPKGTYSPSGRAGGDTVCTSCSSNKFFGSTKCGKSGAPSMLVNSLTILLGGAVATTSLLLWGP